MRAVLANGLTEDPLESEEQLQEQMDSLPYMCRFQYEYAVELIVGRMDPIVAAYQKVTAVLRLRCCALGSSLFPAPHVSLCNLRDAVLERKQSSNWMDWCGEAANICGLMSGAIGL